VYHVTSCTASAFELSCEVVATQGDAFADRFRISKAQPPAERSAGSTDETPLLAVVAIAALLGAAMVRRRTL
jgi:hypothetical protein